MNSCLTPDETLEIFKDEVRQFDGNHDHFKDDRRLFARSVMPPQAEVKPHDVMKGGVALRQLDEEIVIYPFVFRQVCKNGQIMASGSLQRSARITMNERFTAAHEIRETIAECADPATFGSIMEEVKKAPRDTDDRLLNLLPLLQKWMESSSRPRVYRRIMKLFRREENSRFGLMNAVTAYARDLDDPQERWDLEELGGAIAIGAPINPPVLPARAKVPGEERSAERTKRRKLRLEKRKKAAPAREGQPVSL